MQSAGDESAGDIEYPDSFDQLEEWVSTHLGEDVVVVNKAIRAAKKSGHVDPSLTYKALHLLASHYVDMRIDGGQELKESFDERCRELGLRLTNVGQATRDHRYRDAYKVMWKGRTYTMGEHLAGSNDADPTKVFRLYFAWLEDEGVVIVGWMPTHLPSHMTSHC